MVVKKKGANKRKRFKGAVSRNAAKQSRGARFGHLNLPKGVSVFREEPKTRVDLDILPYTVTDEVHPDRDDEYEIAVPGELWYKRPYWLHRGIGANSEDVVCPSSIKQKCPVCEYRAQLLKDGTDWNDDSVKALKPSMRNLYAIIPKGHKNYDEEIHIWDISQFLFQDKLNEEIQENEEYETFPDLEEGYTLRIRFSEDQLGSNKFANTSRIDFNDRDPYGESILDDVLSLDEVLVVPSLKEIQAVFFGGLSQDEIENEDEEEEEEEEEDEEDEEETPAQAKKRKNLQKPESEDDEEEEEDEEDTEEEEEEEKKPKPSRRKTSKKDKGQDKEGQDKDESKKGKKDDRCPHGHKFGKDCEEHDECDECEEWEACLDEAEE